MKLRTFLLWNCISGILSYWDCGTTTISASLWRFDQWVARQSRFRWQRSENYYWKMITPWWDWYELEFRKRLYVVAGVSYQMINLGTASILNRRTLLTAANLLDPYMNDARTVRVWALGRKGEFNTPWRYRVWRLTRINPRSTNPEHCHGPFCYHTPRHDVCIIHTLDQMYIFHEISPKYAYATRTFLTRPWEYLTSNDLFYAGSGFEYHEHVAENYKIFFSITSIYFIKDCSRFLPKWWGKFICIRNHQNFPGVQNGGPLINSVNLVGLGCFMHTYQNEKYFVFTDLRYYVWWIHQLAAIRPGEYYEYAYPHWGTFLEYSYYEDDDRDLEWVNIPTKQIRDSLYPLG